MGQKACFPHKTFEHTEVNPDSGTLNIKKGESTLNTVTAQVTYFIHSNTDVTSLWHCNKGCGGICLQLY
jgi:hypothetical protein